jgi:hypothetical protein
MQAEIRAGGQVVDQETGLATTIVAALGMGEAYFCDPRQDMSEWADTNEPLACRVVVTDDDGDISWGHVGAAAIGIPFDNRVNVFGVGNNVTTGAGDSATIVAIYYTDVAEGILIVTIANPAHSFDDDEAITDAGTGATADVNTSGGAGGGPAVTSATLNACAVYSMERGGTQDWSLVDSNFHSVDTPITYEIRTALYQVSCVTGLELGLSAADMTRLARQGIPPPDSWGYMPYSRVEQTGGGHGRGMGFPSSMWNWNHMSQDQVNRLLVMFPNPYAPTADVHLTTYVDEGGKRTLKHFAGIGHRPVDGQGKAMVMKSSGPTYDNVVFSCTRLIEQGA